MASSEGLDELLAGLASMGFEFEECHEAIQAGNTNLESAVEWLIERKSQSSLSTVQAHQNPANFKDNVPSTSSEEHVKNVDQVALTSRFTISEDAKKAKERFIEKEREQARTEAKKRKLDEKKAKQQILMQIADDREMQKEKSGSKVGLHKDKYVLSGQLPSASIQDVDKPKKDNKECLLKVRLPNGQVRTGSVSITTTLMEAVTIISSSPSLRQQEVEIIQPFPHKTFTSDEIDMSLESLGLHSSAMIVVQKKQAEHSASNSQLQSSSISQNVPESSNNTQQDPDRNPPEDIEHGIEEPEIPVIQPPPIMRNPNVAGRHHPHHWPQGEGMRLGAVEYNPHAINPVSPSSSSGESAARRMEMRERRLHLIDNEETATDVPHFHREVRRLEDICIDNVSLRISGHPKLQPIATLGTLSHNICDKILEQLMKNKTLSRKSMNAFLSCCLRYLRLDCYLLVTNELLSALRWHKNITLLSLKSCPLITDKAIESIAVLKKLQSLNINQCSQLTDKCFVYIKDLPSLTMLQMDGTKVTDEGVSYFVNHSESVTKLTHLSLCNTAITDLSLEVIRNLKSLKVLEVEKTKVTNLDALSEMTNLERLNVSYTQLTDNSIVAIRSLPSLKSLNILSTSITDLGLQQLHSLHLVSLKLPNRLTITDQGLYHIKGFPLTALDISDYINVTDLGIQYISAIHSLAKLTLSNTRLSDVGLRSLSGLVNLVELNVDRTTVTDDGCAVIQNFYNLQILSLSSTQITNRILLNGVINSCGKLSQLNLSRTRISNKGISWVNLPSLTLLNLDWTRVTSDCQILLTGCPCLRALRTNNCSPPTNDDDEEED